MTVATGTRTPGGRSSSLILDVFGLYIRQFEGWIAVSGLVILMRDLGIEEGATRSALSRMVRKGLLERQRRDASNGYRVAPGAEPRMKRADQRILESNEPASIDDGWTIIIATIPETRRKTRDRLRAQLRWLGCGSLGNAVWLVPRRATREVWATLRQFDLDDEMSLFSGTYLGAQDIARMVASAWDLEELQQLYRRFVDDCEAILSGWPSPPAGPDVRAFCDCTDAVHAWRKFPYLDPGLPRGLLPDPWNGDLAIARFSTIRELLGNSALSYVGDIIDATI